MKLYKYDYWDGNEYIRENILKNQMYFNVVKSFNDPFDMFPSYLFQDKYVNQVESSLGTSCEMRNLDANLKKKLNVEDMLEKEALLNDRNYLRKFGITCLSKTKDSILMWSHYAKSHTGICIEYDVDEESFLNNSNLRFLKLIPIKYSNKRPMLEYKPISDTTNDDDMIRRILSTKFEKWGYEQEVRLMCYSELDGAFPATIPHAKSMLKSVYLGANMKLDTFCNFLEFYTENNLVFDIFFMTLDKNAYKLSHRKISKCGINNFLDNLKILKEKPPNRYDQIKDFFRQNSDKALTKWKDTLGKITLNELHICSPQYIFEKDFIKPKSSMEEIELAYFISFVSS